MLTTNKWVLDVETTHSADIVFRCNKIHHAYDVIDSVKVVKCELSAANPTYLQNEEPEYWSICLQLSHSNMEVLEKEVNLLIENLKLTEGVTSVRG